MNLVLSFCVGVSSREIFNVIPDLIKALSSIFLEYNLREVFYTSHDYKLFGPLCVRTEIDDLGITSRLRGCQTSKATHLITNAQVTAKVMS